MIGIKVRVGISVRVGVTARAKVRGRVEDVVQGQAVSMTRRADSCCERVRAGGGGALRVHFERYS